jgi:excisionase family DNA binding protein
MLRNPTEGDGIILYETDVMKMTPRQAASYLRCSVATVYTLCQSKQLVHYRVGKRSGKILIDSVDADRYLASKRVGLIEATPTISIQALQPTTLKHVRL